MNERVDDMFRFLLLLVVASCALDSLAPGQTSPASQPGAGQQREVVVQFQNEYYLPLEPFHGIPDFLQAVFHRLHPDEALPYVATTNRVPAGENEFLVLTPGPGRGMRIQFRGKDAGNVLDAVTKDLTKLVEARRAMTENEAAAQLQTNRLALQEIAQRQEQIAELTDARQKVVADAAVEKMKALELERERITMDLAAKSARAKAVREQMNEAEVQIRGKLADDAVAKQLQKVVQLKNKQLEQIKSLQKSGQANAVDVGTVETDIAEAESRLSERADAVRQSSNGDLINRLASEVATMAIDEAELRARLSLIEKRLPPSDYNTLDEQQLAELVKLYISPPHERSQMPALYEELNKKRRDVLMKILALEVKEVGTE